MSPVSIIILCMIIWPLVIALIYAIERRLVWPYVPVSDVPPERFPPANDYAVRNATAAAAAGFTWLGTFADGKGKLYCARYDFFRSASGDVLALVGTGTVASMTAQYTSMDTLLADGQSLRTFDNLAGGENDLTGLTENVFVRNATFEGLLSAHRARTNSASCPIGSFEEGKALSEFRAYRQIRIQRLVARGYAHYLDAEKEVWRYSIRGAVVMACRQYFTGLQRA